MDTPYSATDPMRPTCGARCRDGHPCRTWPMPNGKCRLHGGKSPSGLAHPSYKHGGNSRYLPPRLAQRAEVALADPDLLSLRHEIAIMDARISDLAEHVDLGTTTQLWLQASTAFAHVESARLVKDATALNLHMARLGTLLQEGATAAASWAELVDHLQGRRQLVESERKRQVEMQQMLSAQEAMALFAAVFALIRENVPDMGARKRIADGMQRLAVLQPGERPADAHPGPNGRTGYDA